MPLVVLSAKPENKQHSIYVYKERIIEWSEKVEKEQRCITSNKYNPYQASPVDTHTSISGGYRPATEGRRDTYHVWLDTRHCWWR